MCSIFIEFFVQFLGVIKCLNNPFFTICRIAHTKKPHRANFLRSLTVTLEQGISLKYILRLGTSRTSPYAISSKDSTSPSWTCAFEPHKKFWYFRFIRNHQNPKPFARFNNPTQIMCTINRCTRFRTQGKNPFRPLNIERR